MLFLDDWLIIDRTGAGMFESDSIVFNTELWPEWGPVGEREPTALERAKALAAVWSRVARELESRSVAPAAAQGGDAPTVDPRRDLVHFRPGTADVICGKNPPFGQVTYSPEKTTCPDCLTLLAAGA